MANALETTQDLIRIPSYSGQEGPLAEYIKTRFAHENLDASIDTKGNVLLHLAGRDQTKAFIFNSHMDVVDVGEDNWKHPPFAAVIEGDTLYGRGAVDMKSGLAGSMEAAIILSKRESLPTDIWFTYVVNEEVDGSGTHAFAEWFKGSYASKYNSLAAIFTEPTDLATIEHGHKGNFFIDATIVGDTGHSSRPGLLKTMAPLQMAQFISGLPKLNTEWAKQDTKEFTPPTVAITSIQAESKSYNKIAEKAVAHLDLRTIPGFHTGAYNQLQELASLHGITLSFAYDPAPTGYTKKDAPIIRAMQSLIPGLNMEVSEASADLGFVTDIGVEGVIFGPGDKNLSHTTDESIPVGEIQRTPELFVNIYDAWAKM
jgi:succinyl-diaminopimelate desuccinylase